MFTRVVISALFAGCLAGLIGGVLQLFFVQPVLLHAELYESGQLTHFGSSSAADTHHTDSTFDLTRDLLSLGFSMAIYVGYGLIMTALMAFRLDNDDTINPSATRICCW